MPDGNSVLLEQMKNVEMENMWASIQLNSWP